ncbi:MAG: DNA primase [Gemmatimonadetes bacterium]|nr:DNA primase [Gemmatimonadota bacterium]
MPIPDELIEEVRQRADLVEIVAEHTRLKRSGRTFRGPCPLHGGEGPNFSVDPGKGFYKCFVCGEGGTVFTFLQRHLGMTFPEAVRDVAARVGVEIPDEREAPRPEDDPNARYYETNAFAAEWFRRQLWEEPGGSDARSYLERRGISRDSAERMGLGWAPEEWTAFGDTARRHGIANELLMSLGLVKESTKGGREPYDAFRARLIFPIESPTGKVLGFGGRVIGEVEDHVPKYLNSPETPVYHKGRVLYGLGWSRQAIRRADEALIVEGYMDYASLMASGVENVVAPLGTALTPEQAELVARYAHRAVLLYDSDSAGLKATFRSGDELLRAGVEVLVATLPDGEDPDSVVRSGGEKALRSYIRDAVDVLERKIQIMERRDLFRSIPGVRRAIDALLPTVRAATDEVTRGVYIARIAEKTGLARETIEREVAQAPTREQRPQARSAPGPRAQGRRPEPYTAPTASLGPERNLLLLLLRDESWVERAANDVGPEEFRSPAYRAIFQELVHLEGRHDSAGDWISSFPPEIVSVVETLLGDPEGQNIGSPERFYLETIGQMVARPFEERLAQLERQLAVAGDDEGLVLSQEKAGILKEMRDRGILKRFGAANRTNLD